MFSTNDLSNFTGTEGYHFNPIFRQVNYTDGVKFVSDNGAAWLVVDALAHLIHNKKVARQSFAAVNVKPNGKGGASMILTDGNKKVLAKQEYCISDLPCEVNLFATDGVLMLASEY